LIDAIRKESLSDSIARALKEMIDRQGFQPGDRLPTIAEMARRFEVGAPTLREALRQLQAVGIVELRHGSGVYVAEHHDALFVANRLAPAAPSRKVLVDLIDSRLALEHYTVAQAAANASDEELDYLRSLLDQAANALSEKDLETLSATNMEFHRRIAEASGNGVAGRLLDLLAGLFSSEQYTILQLYGSPERDLEEHEAILSALQAHDPVLAAQRMKKHLEGVRAVLENYEERGDEQQQES
jgi:GntR family transcriptional repressor for pyruvate dehydrogenase complex